VVAESPSDAQNRRVRSSEEDSLFDNHRRVSDRSAKMFAGAVCVVLCQHRFLYDPRLNLSQALSGSQGLNTLEI